jgi:hypothetical protein
MQPVFVRLAQIVRRLDGFENIRLRLLDPLQQLFALPHNLLEPIGRLCIFDF